jgi:glycosyltransferase involved in cell wall biosynthesis
VHKITILGYSNSVHLTRWAQGLIERGINLSVVSLGGEKIEGVKTINLNPGRGRQWSYIKYLHRVKRIIGEIEPDLVHSHYAAGFGLWGAYSGFHPFLVSVWGTDIIDFPNNFYKKYLLKKILSSADYLTATSHFLGKQTVRIHPSIADKLAVIPFGVKMPEIQADYSDKGQIKLIYIKVHARRYGPDILFKAVHSLIKQGMNISLTMAGSGEMTEELKEMANKLNINKYISFVGFLDNREIAPLLAGHDIMVMPSREESFGVAALEASSVGIPVIASNIGGIPEAVKNNQTGILVPSDNVENLAEAIKKLADNVELRKRMGNAGREFVRTNFDWEKSLDRMIDLYGKLIIGKGRV